MLITNRDNAADQAIAQKISMKLDEHYFVMVSQQE